MSGTRQAGIQHVAVAVIANPAGEILLTRRPPHVHQGGRWEFPGGKLEPGEGVTAALARELQEELGIRLKAARPLIRVRHAYPDRRVLLDVWRVEDYEGQPRGREGQALEWVSPGALDGRALPDANRAIVAAVRLPPLYLITPEPDPDTETFLARLTQSLEAGVRLVQFRARMLSAPAFRELAVAAVRVGQRCGARVLLNAEPEEALACAADGVHLSSRRLMRLRRRPLPADKLVAASCHDRREVRQAARIGADFIVVSPVLATPSHPGAPPLGWEGLRVLTDEAVMPAYALGGLGPRLLGEAWRSGAQGIAAIRSLWGGACPGIQETSAACQGWPPGRGDSRG